jgi:hypothetical protein
MKTFTVAGTSIENGTIKFRAANELASRTKMLVRHKNTCIQLVELPQPMSKPDAASYLLTLAEFSDKHPLLVSIVNSVSKAATTAPKAKKAVPLPVVTDVVVEETGTKWQAIINEKRIAFPSHTHAQLLELARFQAQVNLKAFNDVEPTF